MARHKHTRKQHSKDGVYTPDDPARNLPPFSAAAGGGGAPDTDAPRIRRAEDAAFTGT